MWQSCPVCKRAYDRENQRECMRVAKDKAAGLWWDAFDTVTAVRRDGGEERKCRRECQADGLFPVDSDDSETATTFAYAHPPCTCSDADKQAARKERPTV